VRDGYHHSALGAVPVGTAADGDATLIVRQEDVVLASRLHSTGPDEHTVDGIVEDVRIAGARTEVTVRCGSVLLHAETSLSVTRRVGDSVAVVLPADAVHLVTD